MKILHIVDHSIPLHSGYTFRSRAIFQAQHSHGWETEQITSSKHAKFIEDQLEEEVVDNLHFFRTPDDPSLLSKLPILNQWDIVRKLVKRLKEVIPKVKPNILHAHSPALNGIAALIVGKKFKLPVIYEIRAFWEDAAVSHGTARENGLRYRLTRWLETYVVKKADGITCICNGIKNDLIQRGIDPEKITIIPNAVNLEDFEPVSEKNRELELQLDLEGNFVLGFIGSFYKYEGLHLLLQAMPAIIAQSPNIKLLLVGGGQDEDLLKELGDQLGIQSHLIFTGRVPHDQVHNYYSLIDLLVYPRVSMRITELVTPLKPLEAMAQKQLVLASDIGGHREMIFPNKNGFLFKADDVDDLVENIIKISNNINGYDSLKEAGWEYVNAERNWMASTENYKSIYQQVLS